MATHGTTHRDAGSKSPGSVGWRARAAAFWGRILRPADDEPALGEEGRRAARRSVPPRGAWGEPVSRIRSEMTSEAEMRLYGEMRRAFPILDVALTRLVQLSGSPRIVAAPSVQAELEHWMATVSAGPGQRGLQSWLEAYLDHLLVYGRGVGEITLAPSRREVLAVTTVDPLAVRLTAGESPFSLRVMRKLPGAFQSEPMHPALTLVSLRAPQGGSGGCIGGTSLLRSLRFVAEACSLIENATAQVWQRVGCPSFHVNWSADPSVSDPQGILGDSVLERLEAGFSEMMTARRHGEVRDFFTSGKVEVSIIGREGQLLAVQEHLRVFMEQMVAVTGIPPWLLGLHWSATERLSVQQADLLVANIEALRREVQPQLEYLLETRQRLRGAGGPGGRFRLEWPAVNLRDATEQARADAWREQARQRRIENARRMWELGFWSQDRAAQEADETVRAAHRPLGQVPGETARLSTHLTPPIDSE